MTDVFTILILLMLASGGFLVLRRLMIARQPMYPPMEIPWQSPYGPKDDYGRSFYPHEGYNELENQRYGPRYGELRYGRPAYEPEYNYPGYGRPTYDPGYPPQSGMSSWAVGGLGALGGGLLGYHLGQMAGEQQASESESGSSDQMLPLDQGGYDPGMIDARSFDGGFADVGADFGGEW